MFVLKNKKRKMKLNKKEWLDSELIECLAEEALEDASHSSENDLECTVRELELDSDVVEEAMDFMKEALSRSSEGKVPVKTPLPSKR